MTQIDHHAGHELALFFSKYPSFHFGKHEHLLHPCHNIEQVYYLCSGAIRQYTLAKNGNELTITIFKPGTMLFFLQLFNQSNSENQYYYQALEPSTVQIAPFLETKTYLQAHGKLLLEFLGRMSRGLEGFSNYFRIMILGTGCEKVSALLLMLSERFGKQIKEGTLIDLALTHYDLACMIGISRETLSKIMEQLEQQRLLVHKSKKTIIINLLGLQKLSMV